MATEFQHIDNEIDIDDVLDCLGTNWVFEVNQYGYPEFRYTLMQVPLVDRGKFEKQFKGYTFDLYKVGGIGFVIRIHVLSAYRLQFRGMSLRLKSIDSLN
jgi:hypothetical protein